MIPSQAQQISRLNLSNYSIHPLRAAIGVCLLCCNISPTKCFAQAIVPAARLAPAVVLAPGAPVNNDRDLAARRWVRGLIQQELHAVHSLCKLNPQQAKDLVDTIESQWKSKLASTFLQFQLFLVHHIYQIRKIIRQIFLYPYTLYQLSFFLS